MKEPKKSHKDESPAITQEFPRRLCELEAELLQHGARLPESRPLKTIDIPAVHEIEKEKVLRFSVGNKRYAAGHSDLTYSGSNHTRGVRHIRFYALDQIVLDIEGDFEDQQFGANFRFQSITRYVPGEWEADFMSLTDDLRRHAEKRKKAFQKKRQSKSHSRA